MKYIIPPWDIYGDHTEFDYIGKPVDDEFLDILSLSQLRLFRNAFYALHGKVLSEPDLAEYFGNSPWYKPRSDYKESDLTAIDCENIRRIEAKEEWLRELVATQTVRQP